MLNAQCVNGSIEDSVNRLSQEPAVTGKGLCRRRVGMV